MINKFFTLFTPGQVSIGASRAMGPESMRERLAQEGVMEESYQRFKKFSTEAHPGSWMYAHVVDKYSWERTYVVVRVD